MSVYAGPEIVNDGLVLHLDAANIRSYNYNFATYSQDFENAVYTKSTGLVTATGILAPDNTLTATTLTDDSAAAYENFARNFTVPNDTSSHNISIYIKKTSGGTSSRTGFNVGFNTGGTQKSYNIRFNADTGAVTGGDTSLVTSENNDYWRLSFTISNNNTGNTNMYVQFYPATGVYNGTDIASATGSHTVWGLQVTKNATLLPYKSNTNVLANNWSDLMNTTNSAVFQVATDFLANNGGIFSFNGTTQYATIAAAGPSVAAAGTVTQEAVINMINTAPLQCVFCRGRTGVSFNYGITINSNTLRFRNSSQDHIVSGPLSTNTWYHLVIVTTPSGSVGYVNGVRQPNTTAQTTSTNSLQEITIGRRSTNSALEYLNGNIALIRVYHDKAFTDAEVQQNFNAIRGRFNV